MRASVRRASSVSAIRCHPSQFALLLALGSSPAYGCADFLGGLGARKAHVLRTVMIAAPASLALTRTTTAPGRSPACSSSPGTPPSTTPSGRPGSRTATTSAS
ncbi:hypothetical protein GT034_03765 [Streptomyces sp. SID2563]|nr:hypothetical protein [Streptomyces sp. SID2563]